MTLEEMKDLARRGAEDCWKRGDLDALDAILSPDYRVYIAGVLSYDGRDAMKRAVTEARQAFPDVEVTVEDLIAQGDKVVARIRREPDPFIEKIVAGWPRKFAAKRAVELGFKPDASFEEIIRIHIEDELGGRIA